MLTLSLVPLSLLALAPRLGLCDDSSDSDSSSNSTATPNLKQNSNNCSCYAIGSGSSNSSEFFSYHRFYDFRSLATSADQFTTPDPVSDDEDQGTEGVVADDAGYLNSTGFMDDWEIQNWSTNASADFPVRMVNTARNIYISDDTGNTDIEYPTYLTMRTVRLADFSSASEMQNNQQNMMHASVRMRARVVGASGAVAGFFTYYDDDNEADIEILTQYPSNQYEYTNQPSVSKDGNEITAATVNVTMPSSDAADDWTQWHDHRIDWLPHRCNWYLDGRLVASNSYSVPRKPSGLVLNMWSNGGSWSGNMTEGDAAEFHVQWVQMVFNTSGPRGGPDAETKKMRRSARLLEEREWPEEQLGPGCETVCRVDGVKAVGYPEVAYVSMGGAAGLVAGHAVVWCVVAAVGALLAWS
ncbi:concanavalin A-like lectin/glucanase domain-containing protein [Phyllosticta capitalensis]|uniref:Concanavalin A-like lectin/glucanase domain-containing protein n=1 Tax=Phyllosticta capitalensis TaxID=121624 RepID=A0ABR1YVK7_9PEZI